MAKRKRPSRLKAKMMANRRKRRVQVVLKNDRINALRATLRGPVPERPLSVAQVATR